MVLPAVATKIVGQYSEGLSLIRPNTAGSEPSGSNVADTSDTTKTEDKPDSGKANAVRTEANQASMGPIIGKAHGSFGPKPGRYTAASFLSSPQSVACPPPLPAMQIGPHALPNRLFVAPMAGVTDRPFRQLCKRLGAGYAVSEMVTSKPELWASLKTSRRADHSGEPGPIAVQIAGVDPAEMADAARYNIDRGAQIIDINMGCPAKKVCNVWAGSALMRDAPLAMAIIEAVVAVAQPRGVPVTLKMRTGWCAAERHAVAIARAAESAGIAMLTVHGRTREIGRAHV